MKLSLKDLKLDDEIYPRINRSPKTIDEYVASLRAGDKFPPLTVQRISNGNAGVQTIVLDGYHRMEAYRVYNRWVKQIKEQQRLAEDHPFESATFIEETDIIYWKNDTLDREEWFSRLLLESARLNCRHGLRLQTEDKIEVARNIYKRDPSLTLEEIGNSLGEHHQRISEWLSDLTAKQESQENAIIFRHSLLGWTQHEILAILDNGMAQNTISTRLSKMPETAKLILSLVEQGKSIDEVNKTLGFNLLTTWALYLEEKSDLERFQLFGMSEYQNDKPRIYNVWNFTKLDQRLGQRHPGNIPGQIVMNVLYYWTNPGELIVDPMAGGGSTIDASLVMGRNCRAYDLEPKRVDIQAHNLEDGFPQRAKNCNLIFLDPPYWRLMRGDYAAGSISNKSLDSWRKFMEKLAHDSFETVKEGGHVALIIEAFNDERETGDFLDLPFECLNWFLDAGFTQRERISVPLNSQIKSHRDVEYAKQKHILLDLNRDLIIFQK